MKQRVKTVISFMLMMVLLFSVAMPVQAKSNGDIIKRKTTVKELKAGSRAKGENTSTETWNEEKNRWVYTYNYTIYKIKIPADGYITVTNYNYKNDDNDLYLFDDLSKAKSNVGVYYPEGRIYTFNGRKTENFPVAKGTYYIYSYRIGSYNFKYAFKAVSPKGDNYCAANAKTLKAKKKVIISTPRNYNYDRWYKIKLTSSKRISFTFEDMLISAENASNSPSFDLYDSEKNHISLVHDSGFRYEPISKLAKGTYYIRVNTGVWANSNYSLYRLSWK